MELKHALAQAQEEEHADAVFIPLSEATLLFLYREAGFEIMQMNDEAFCGQLPPDVFWDRRIWGEGRYGDTRPVESQQWESVGKDLSNVPGWARAVVEKIITRF